MIQGRYKNNSGQSMLEYILLSLAVVVVVISVVPRNGIFAQAVNKTLQQSVSMINVLNSKIYFRKIN